MATLVPPAVTVREGSAGDLQPLMSVMRAAFDPVYGEAWSEPQTAGMLALPGVRLWLAERDGQPLGFALVRTVLDEAELLMLAVIPTARGHGTGGALLAAAMTAARAAGARAIFLEMRSGNPAHILYCRSGFTQIGERRDYYRGADGARFDASTYRLSLD